MHVVVDPYDPLPYVKVVVQLSPEEQNIVRKKDLWGEILHSRPNPNYQIDLQTYDDLMESYTWRKAHAGWLEKKVYPVIAPIPPKKEIHVSLADVCQESGYVFKFNSHPEAKVFTIDLRERVLPWIKTLITTGSSPTKTQTFDL